MYLKSGKTFEVKKGDDQYLRPLGFIGEDFIYGQANAADVVPEAEYLDYHSIVDIIGV